MDEATERKIRDLRLKILKVEKELAARQHSANLGTWLHAGHAGQIQRTAERDRQRLETKLKELKTKLEAVIPGSTKPAAIPKREVAKKTVAKPAPAAKKKAAAKKPAAKKETARKKTRS